ncbi:hypothetical protein [Actinacidiphila sp. ITFR-21]|uniref:hypothetical protein n=1 Tax=Actinacidiphila sp. ITFR-21 TaxID=3075199 RepID=UPI00288BB3CB|nr:hypothetical protein [Streptomyces sp. ITFR-21]WNI19967.1 hypothetical protein RLT57_30975 [Streptomyces sp. ITFR-21]
MTTPTATCFGPAGARVAVTAGRDEAAALARLFTPWWDCAPQSGAQPAAHIGVHVSERLHGQAVDAFRTAAARPRTGRYAGSPLVATAGADGTVHALAPDAGVAYRSAGGSVTVVGRDRDRVVAASFQVAADLVQGLMESQGYTLLRASSAVHGGQAVLGLGGPGPDRSGRAAAALLLAARHRFGLQATDQVFARAEADGTVSTRPRTGPIALGLGLLDALGWYGTVRERLAGGEALHPGTDRHVAVALAAGRRTPLFGPAGERTARLWPDQVFSWFGLVPAHAATAAAVAFPAADPTVAPAFTGRRAVTDGDLLLPAPDGEDPLGLRPLHPAARRTAADRLLAALNRLPHHTTPPPRTAAACAPGGAPATP